MKFVALAMATVAAVLLGWAVPGVTFAASTSASSFGPGDKAWDNYYSNPANEATWGPFCKGGGATLVTSVQGVPACGPTPAAGGTDIYLPDKVGPVAGFQCVELAERYLYVKYGWKPISHTNGAQIVKNYAAQDNVSVTTNDTHGDAPMVGDVMSFSKYPTFSGIGHTAIVSASSVDSSGNGTVTVIGENQNLLKGYNGFTAGSVTMTVTGWTIQSFDKNSYIEWLNNASSGTHWPIQAVPSPSGATNSSLASVSCTSATTCTAVGSYQTNSIFSATLAEAWNGASWTIQHTPNPPGGNSTLDSVSCSTNACTAVGYSATSTLSEGWNGTVWTIQHTATPAGSPRYSSLFGVSCTSASACTAVGDYANSSGLPLTLAERWNGTSWTIQHTPNPASSTDSALDGVSCTSASACTAVGDYTNSSGHQFTLAERWNGASWTIQNTPSSSGVGLYGISCTSPSACTAVGSSATGTLAAAWNGTVWTTQATPNPAGATDSSLDGVFCTSASACTATGQYRPSPQSWATLAETWNGTSWTIQNTPNPSGATYSFLNDVSCTSASTCTAVGDYSPNQGASFSPLAENESG
jgi:hypothetical protein